MKFKRIQLIVLFIIFSFFGSSQEISNVHFEQVGKQIHIYYDLEGDEEYLVKVYCSTDIRQSWGEPLKFITGAVGDNQMPGKNKKIIWDVLKETEKLSGEILFKVIAQNDNSGTFIDSRDGQTYSWVKIGDQVWMAENLNFRVEDSYCYDNKSANCLIYGRLYNGWDAKDVCPYGWHLPSIDEWIILKDYLGDGAGGKMKEKGTTHWKHPNKGATNSSGFTALPGGERFVRFEQLASRAYWWSATDGFETNAKRCRILYSNDKLGFGPNSKGLELSVRCVKD